MTLFSLLIVVTTAATASDALTDCTDVFKNRVSSIEYLYYPSRWLSGPTAHQWTASTWWSETPDALSSPDFRWVVHDCGGSVCLELEAGAGDYLSVGSTPQVVHRSNLIDVKKDPRFRFKIFCPNRCAATAETTDSETFDGCQIRSAKDFSKLYTTAGGYARSCRSCGRNFPRYYYLKGE